jgi:hypothetical protein
MTRFIAELLFYLFQGGAGARRMAGGEGTALAFSPGESQGLAVESTVTGRHGRACPGHRP